MIKETNAVEDLTHINEFYIAGVPVLKVNCGNFMIE